LKILASLQKEPLLVMHIVESFSFKWFGYYNTKQVQDLIL